MINSIMNVLRNVRFISIEGNNNINGIYEHFIKLMGTWEFLFIVIIYAIIYWIYSNKYFRDNKKIIQIILTILFFSIIGCFYWKKLSLLLIIGGFFVLISSIFSERDEKEKGELVEEENLYPTRNEFKGIFLEALKRYNLIALDGSWGSGKTFFIEKVLEEEKSHKIFIDIMLFDNRKSLKQEFRNQLKEILKKEGFLEGVLIDFDHYLNDIVNDKIKILRNFFFRKSESFLSASKKLKETITKLDNKVILIIDNLERIHKSDDKEWKEILGFIHELKEIGLKIVMLINTEEMKEKDSIEYFDKFFEQKLLLNDVEIEEIVGEIETDTNKKDFIEYMRTLEKNLKEEISSIELKGNNIQNEERKRDELNLKKLNVLIITLKELFNNSRKLEK